MVKSNLSRGVVLLAHLVVCVSTNRDGAVEPTEAHLCIGETRRRSLAVELDGIFDALDLDQPCEQEDLRRRRNSRMHPGALGLSMPSHGTPRGAAVLGRTKKKCALMFGGLGCRAESGHELELLSVQNFEVPKGGELYVWNGDRSAFLGAFTSTTTTNRMGRTCDRAAGRRGRRCVGIPPASQA